MRESEIETVDSSDRDRKRKRRICNIPQISRRILMLVKTKENSYCAGTLFSAMQ